MNKFSLSYFDKFGKNQIIKYFIISSFGYAYVFLSLFLLIEVFTLNETASFLIVYGVLYVALYFVQLKYLFKKKHDKSKFIKFIWTVCLFYLSANGVFNLIMSAGENYLISTVVTIVTLFPLRFITFKYFVYRN